MFMSRMIWMSAVIATCGLLTGAPVWGQKTVEKSEKEETAALVESLARAAELTAFGRGELADVTGVKDFKSPEALVAAGGILLRVHKQTAGKTAPSDAKVTDEGGQAVAEESGTAESLAAEAAALFDEARAMPTKDKAALEAQIKQAETVVASRGGGLPPRVVSRVITTGHAHTIHLPVRPAAAVIAVQGAGRTHFEAVGPGGRVLWHSHGPRGVYNVHGGKDVTLKVINHGPAAKYKVFAN